MFILLIIICLLFILEVKFKPRIDIVDTYKYKQVLLYYSIKGKYGIISREYLKLFKY